MVSSCLLDDLGAHLGLGVERVAHHQRLRPLHQSLDEARRGPSGTSTRLPALQTSPLFPKIPQKQASTARSMSASGKMICGLFPPSSRVSFFRLVSAEACSSRRAVRIEPVKAILSTPGWRASASPVGSPYPGTTLSTPGGNPTSRASSPSFIAVSGVSSLGLRITVHPVASAGPSFQQARQVG